ncbi:MAG: DegV family EDD domain-containing protein [Gemmatimonadota bacterium]|nr:DegV family EDD domain-containing protein [Gemmatimonadota bacterium]
MGSTAPNRRKLQIGYLDGRRFRKLILAGVRCVSGERAELDRINVFPVPDGDTGTNLTLTLRAIADAVRPLKSRSLAEVVGVAAEASVLGARGNSGMLFSHLLLGFATGVGGRFKAGAAEVAEAFSAAAARLHGALEDPREGTIVSVVRDMAEAGMAGGKFRHGDLIPWLRDLQIEADASLRRTRELLPELKQAGVVDAGAKGFVKFFEGVLQLIEGHVESRSLESTTSSESRPSLYFAREGGAGAGEGRYCTQVAIRGQLPDTAALRQAIAGLGTSTIILRSGSVAKVHIHSDEPQTVLVTLSRFGTIESEVIEDTLLAGTASHHTALLTDSASDLPRDWVERHGVHVVPMQVIVGDRVYRDGVDLQPDELLALMRDPSIRPSTSQPPPAAFEAAARDALDHGAEELLGVFMSSAVSGTFASGAKTLQTFEDVPVEVIDSRSGSLGVGLLVIRAIELLEQGFDLPALAEEIRRVRDQSNVFFTVDTMDHLVRSGRIGRTKALVGGMLDVKPILSLTPDGRVVPIGRARGRDAVADEVFKLLDEKLDGASQVRFGVAHFGAQDAAERIAEKLQACYAPREVLVGAASASLGVHTGPGTWALAYQIEDGTPARVED